MSLSINPLRPVMAVLVAALVLTACGGDDKKKPATQVAAKVNQEEISVHQINAVLSRAGNLSPEQANKASREVLEKLIDQELLVQKAIEKKIDRDPKTMQAIEASKRQIIAQAYLEQLVGSVAKPTAEEIKAYYDKHPELFSERRVYRLQEIAAAVSQEQSPAVQEFMAKAKSLDEVAAKLKESNIKFAGNASTKAAEQLPLELLPRLHQMKDGQVAVFPNPNGLLIVHVVASQVAPLDQAAATPLIEQFLNNQKRTEAAAKEVAALRTAGKIEYVGSFVKADADKAADKKDVPPAAPAAPAPAPAPAKTEKPAATGGVSAESISKGVAGLK
jgi:EpsD family peptidyl-prolyl cis-trans isomerase